MSEGKALRCVTVHAHFYQPSREHPWLDEVEAEPSAAPQHDWNARVTAECYRPNTAARLLGPDLRIRGCMNTFEWISFNVGPTLLRWLARARPDVYARVVEADRRSAARQGGHGNAIAQPYVHAILPLQAPRDRLTLVRWGVADFRRRYGRDPAGMWLPETAVDRSTLAVLADEGLRFTILAPGQVDRVRPPGAEGWRPAGQALDPGVPYRVSLAGGRSIVAFVYDGGLAHDVAFGGLLDSGEALAARLLAALDPPPGAASPPGPRLGHVATDGESYGHHHRFGEMALAAALARVSGSGQATLGSYGAFLAAWPPGRPMPEAELLEPSSWSCAHGVDRWRADCGCRTGGPERHQRWRGPLREALDWLAGALDARFETRGGDLFKDPWAARDAYVEVLLDGSPESQAGFLARQAPRSLAQEEKVRALELLEAQRHRLLMYTSCGWFFDDLTGREAVQVLRHAARAVGLTGAADRAGDLEAELVRRLGAAPSNDPQLPTGAEIYEQRVRPLAVTAAQVAAQPGLAGEVSASGPWRVGGFLVEARSRPAGRARRPSSIPTVQRVKVTERATTEVSSFAVVRGARPPVGTQVAVLRDCPARGRPAPGRAGSLEAAVELGGTVYGPEALLSPAASWIAARTALEAGGGVAAAIRGARDEARTAIAAVRRSGERMPPELARVVDLAAGLEVEAALLVLAEGDLASGRRQVEVALTGAAALGSVPRPDPDLVAARLGAALIHCLDRLAVDVEEAAAGALAVLAMSRTLGVAVDLWEAQTALAPRWVGDGHGPNPTRDLRLAPLASALGFENGPTS